MMRNLPEGLFRQIKKEEERQGRKAWRLRVMGPAISVTALEALLRSVLAEPDRLTAVKEFGNSFEAHLSREWARDQLLALDGRKLKRHGKPLSVVAIPWTMSTEEIFFFVHAKIVQWEQEKVWNAELRSKPPPTSTPPTFKKYQKVRAVEAERETAEADAPTVAQVGAQKQRPSDRTRARSKNPTSGQAKPKKVASLSTMLIPTVNWDKHKDLAVPDGSCSTCFRRDLPHKHSGKECQVAREIHRRAQLNPNLAQKNQGKGDGRPAAQGQGKSAQPSTGDPEACHNCGKKGHWKRDCPQLSSSGGKGQGAQ